MHSFDRAGHLVSNACTRICTKWRAARVQHNLWRRGTANLLFIVADPGADVGNSDFTVPIAGHDGVYPHHYCFVDYAAGLGDTTDTTKPDIDLNRAFLNDLHYDADIPDDLRYGRFALS